MTTYARIINGRALDVVTGDPAELFHADLSVEFVVVPDGTEKDDRFDGATWTKAPVATVASPAVAALQPLTPMTFYLAFKPAERIMIKKSDDEQVQEFWASYELAVQLGKDVDPNLVSVKEGVAYLAQGPNDSPPGPGILANKDRIQEILAGIPQ